MPIARFKNLCMDAGNVPALADFWARLLGGRKTDLDDGSARVDLRADGPANDSIWVLSVPEPRTVKNRVHVEVRFGGTDPAALIAAGATVVRKPGEERWWVLADPEGNLFCAVPTADSPASPTAPLSMVVDCRDSAAQAAWWAGVVGGQVDAHDGYAILAGADGFPWKDWIFNEVPEPKTVKNRLHWDIQLLDADHTALLEAGATLLREPDGDIHWWVLADPEGNEFCAFAPRS
jgi:hypothetical protein